MQVTFYARRDGAAVRSGPHVTKPVVQTLNENEPVSVVGKLLFNDDEVKERVWYELRLAGGGTGFSSEDELLSDRALKEKNRYRQWVTQLDETLYRLRGEGTGPHHQRSGVWIPGNNCLDFHEVALVDHRSVPRPNQVNANLNDPAIAIFFSLVHFVVVEDTTIHVATAEEPAKFRFGRLERIKDVNGKAAYRARMADGGEGFVLSFDGPRFAMAHDVVPSKGPVTPSQVCTDAEADDIQKSSSAFWFAVSR
jgi:hypothetical protein